LALTAARLSGCCFCRALQLVDFCRFPFSPFWLEAFYYTLSTVPVTTLDYNTSRTALPVPEYGRTVQNMALELLSIEDRDKRLQQAAAVVEVMSALNPSLKGTEDFKRVLWDHLYLMTEGKLDVDGPYPPPAPRTEAAPLDPIPYPQTKLRHRHLGRKFDEVLKMVMAEEDAEKRQVLTQQLGYFMKLAYAGWMKENPDDTAIRTELVRLSEGHLQYEAGGPGGGRIYFNPAAQQGGAKRGKAYKGGRGGGGGYGSGGGGSKTGGKKYYRNKK